MRKPGDSITVSCGPLTPVDTAGTIAPSIQNNRPFPKTSSFSAFLLHQSVASAFKVSLLRRISILYPLKSPLNKTVNTCPAQWTLMTVVDSQSHSLTLIETNSASVLPSAVQSLVPISSPDIDESSDRWCLPFHGLPVIPAIYYP